MLSSKNTCINTKIRDTNTHVGTTIFGSFDTVYNKSALPKLVIHKDNTTRTIVHHEIIESVYALVVPHNNRHTDHKMAPIKKTVYACVRIFIELLGKWLCNHHKEATNAIAVKIIEA